MARYNVYYTFKRLDGHILKVEADNAEHAAKIAQEKMKTAESIKVYAPICGFEIKVKKVEKVKDGRKE